MREVVIKEDPVKYHDNGLVYLRKLTAEDVTDTYLNWFRDPFVTQYLDAKNLMHQEVVDYIDSGHRSGLHIMYGIFDRVNDVHIGNMKIGPINWTHRNGGLVTLIGDRGYWGKGIGREAIRIGVRLAFGIHGLRKLSDGIIDGNKGSIKAYMAAGWVIEGRMKGHCLVNGVPRDRIVISCFNPEFFPEEA